MVSDASAASTGESAVGFDGPPTLIASDVDGTLIDDQNTVSPFTIGVLGAACDAGTEFVLATGRPPRWIAEITDQFPGSAVNVRYAVCANGAIIYDVANDKIVYSSLLQTDRLAVLREVIARCLPDAGVAGERVGSSEFDAATPPFVATAGYRHAWLNPDHIEVGDDEVYAEPVVKLLVRQPDLASGEMARRLLPEVDGIAQVTFSTDNGLIELSVPDTHKASGLDKLIDLAGLSGERTVAFGDMPNDVEMLTWAGHGVAMGHAHPAAIAAADEVTVGNNEDGVARVLARWFG